MSTNDKPCTFSDHPAKRHWHYGGRHWCSEYGSPLLWQNDETPGPAYYKPATNDATPAMAAQLARVGLGADEGHRETLGTREGLTLARARQWGKNSEVIKDLVARLERVAALAEGLDGEASFARDDDDGTAQALGYAADAIRRAIDGR